MKNMCMDCGKDISPKAKRCKSCSIRHTWAQPGHKEKRSAQITYTHNECIDCGTTIATMNAKRCRSCDTKHRWTQPEFRAKMAAVHNTPEFKERMGAAVRAQWAKPESNIRQSFSSSEHKAEMSAGMATAWSSPKQRRSWLEGIAKRERRKASSIEIIIKVFLDANFLEVIHQYVPDEDMSPGVYDFLIPAIDTIIEVNGDYWHAPGHDQRKDLEKEAWALEHDYTFIRIKEDDAKDSKYLLSLLKEMRAH